MPYLLLIITLCFTCGKKYHKALIYYVHDCRYQGSRYLWWIKSLLISCKVSKHYVHNCLSTSLTKTQASESFYLEVFALNRTFHQKSTTNQNLKLSNDVLNQIWKIMFTENYSILNFSAMRSFCIPIRDLRKTLKTWKIYNIEVSRRLEQVTRKKLFPQIIAEKIYEAMSRNRAKLYMARKQWHLILDNSWPLLPKFDFWRGDQALGSAFF